MSYAYSPGLKVMKATIVRKSRILPIPGEILVREGDSVSADTIVARTYVPGNIHMRPIAYILGIEPNELPQVMLKKEGENIKKDELLAVSKSFFGLFKSEYKAKDTGSIELISSITGMVGIRELPIPINRNAYISGRVTQITPKIGVTIETPAAFIQGIFGIGSERQGELKTIAAPDEVLTIDHIGQEYAGKILVIGALVTSDVLRRAEEVGVKGVIAGGIRRNDLTSYLGFEMGVAITGNEDIGITCIITEGFGKMTMAHHTYKLLKSLDGKLASINGATQIRAGVIRPEVVVPMSEIDVNRPKEEESLVSGMEFGTRVRIIRQPYRGAIGQIVAFPVKLQKLETESSVRVVVVELDDGRRVIIPRANVEMVEE